MTKPAITRRKSVSDEPRGRAAPNAGAYKPLTSEERLDSPRVIAQLEETLWRVLLSEPTTFGKLADLIGEMLPQELSTKDQSRLRGMLARARAHAARCCKASQKKAAFERAAARLAAEMLRIDRDRELVREAKKAIAAQSNTRQGKGWKARSNHAASVERAAGKVETARHRFIESNQGLVTEVAKRFKNGKTPLADLVQEGNLGLIVAINRFDHKKGFRFSTYACWWIQSAIGRSIEKKGSIVRVPVSTMKTFGKLGRVERTVRARTGRPPTDEEITLETGWDSEQLKRVKNKTLARTYSLDQTISRSDELRYIDTLTDDDTYSPFDSAVLRMWSKDLDDLLEILSPRERTIIRARFGLSDFEEMSLEQIGKELGLSRERIRQIQESAIGKLRQTLELDAA